jgi:CheY-like chemotaxis protein
MGGNKELVLVADDDPALRMLCRVNLELEGYAVVEAEKQEDVERLLAEHDVALVFLDVHLGRDDGVVLAAALRDRYPNLPIAFLTGSAIGPVGEGIVDGRISKPFTLEQLADVARALVQGRPAARA